MENSLIRSEISALIKDIVSTEKNGVISAEFAFPDNFTGFSGHFPGTPVLPGICQIQCVLVLLEKVFKTEIKLFSVSRAKFLNPVLPKDNILIAGTAVCQGDTIEAKFKITGKTEISSADEKELTVSRLNIKCRIQKN